MGSDIFKTILYRKIDNFVNQFVQDSNTIFKINNSLIHPLEYGIYKEQAFKEILKLTLPKNLSLSDGFIITSKNRVSTQCDIIIHDSEIPLIEDSIAKFFPIELVLGIIEIKSNLSKKAFILALRKMAENKKLMSDKKCYTLEKSQNYHIFSVLICNKFDFDYRSLNFNKIYEGIEREYWHNTILSINDGIVTYKLYINDLKYIPSEWKHNLNLNKATEWEYPIAKNYTDIYYPECVFIQVNKTNKYFHIEYALSIISNIISAHIKENFELTAYLDYVAQIHKNE